MHIVIDLPHLPTLGARVPAGLEATVDVLSGDGHLRLDLALSGLRNDGPDPLPILWADEDGRVELDAGDAARIGPIREATDIATGTAIPWSGEKPFGVHLAAHASCVYLLQR